MKVVVEPKSSKAKNRLANLMEGNPFCTVEQRRENSLFLASTNKRYFFWVNIHNDPHWDIIEDD